MYARFVLLVYARFVLLDLATAAVLLSMLACGVGSGDVAYVSEWIYQCKRSASFQNTMRAWCSGS
jgi:hypothetical protein